MENGHAWLYFVEADGFRTPANLRRAHFKSGQLANFESVQLEGDITAWAWPRVSRSSSGLYGLIMRVKKSVDVAFSNDGVSFGKWEFLAEETGSTPAIAAFSDGRWVIAFQHGPMAKTRSYFRTAFQSEGNQSGWTEQQLVYPESDNVHITMPVVRHDGKIDLYFLTPPGDWHGFAIHRRCLEPDGTLGDVQMVVPYEFGNLLEPHVTRIAPDLLLLTFNEQRIGSHLHAAPLAEDAACPSDNP